MISFETLLYTTVMMLKAFQCVQVLAARHSNHRVQIMATTSSCCLFFKELCLMRVVTLAWACGMRLVGMRLSACVQSSRGHGRT
jgi:hypothetical protein